MAELDQVKNINARQIKLLQEKTGGPVICVIRYHRRPSNDDLRDPQVCGVVDTYSSTALAGPVASEPAVRHSGGRLVTPDRAAFAAGYVVVEQAVYECRVCVKAGSSSASITIAVPDYAVPDCRGCPVPELQSPAAGVETEDNCKTINSGNRSNGWI